MDVHNVRLYQVGPHLLLISLAAWLFGAGRYWAAGVQAVVSITWFGLALQYRIRRHKRSDQRKADDRGMARNFLVATAVPLLTVGLALIVAPGAAVRPALASFALALPLAAVLISSMIDWYGILPFRDGVTGPPVCQPEVTLRDRRFVTKLWVAHRLFAEVCFFAGAVGTVALIALHYSVDLKQIDGAFAWIGGVGVAIAVLAKRWLAGALRFTQVQGPALGMWVHGATPDGPVQGFLLSASVDPGLVVVERAQGPEANISLRKAIRDGTDYEKTDFRCPPDRCLNWIASGEAVYCERGRQRDQSA